ncbi:MAG: hypothetical protein MJZ81_00875 [Bacteroidales bacterium]|nr:hypothetical protein [Bacteroidales bacterium]
MNNTFDINRFAKVVAKDIRSIWPLAGNLILVITLLPIIPWVLDLAFGTELFDGGFPAAIRWAAILMAAMLVGLIAPSRLYNNCNLPKEGIYFAMLPASKLEKYCSMVLVGCIVSPIVSILGGIAVDTFLRILPFGCYHESLFAIFGDIRDAVASITQTGEKNELYTLYRITSPLFWILIYLSNAVTFLFTCTIFKRHKFLYTILWMWLLSFVFSNIMGIGMTVLALQGGWLENFFDSMIEMLETTDPIRPIRLMFNAYTIYCAAWIMAFGWWAWYRLKNMKY